MRNALLLCTFVACASFVGCAEKGLDGLLPVTGTITYKGAPVEGATVVFNPVDKGRAASAITDANGRYTLTTLREDDGAGPGKYNVFVSKTIVEGKTGLTPEEARETLKKPKVVAPPRKDLIPKRYQSTTGGLFAEVKQGETNDFPFDLTD